MYEKLLERLKMNKLFGDMYVLEYKELDICIKALEKQTGVTSHSERDIVDGCITLMENMWKEFIAYLDYMEVDYGSDDMPSFSHTYFYIVQQLLLSRTHHSGGTSTRQKCKELGLDWSRSIEFRIDEDGEGVVNE